MLTAFLYPKERKEIDMKKLRRIENIKEENKKLKVAAYCRGSTKFESQQSSIELQVSNYETIIQSNSQWEYAGVYFDYGSGLRQKGRSNLENMQTYTLAPGVIAAVMPGHVRRTMVCGK